MVHEFGKNTSTPPYLLPILSGCNDSCVYAFAKILGTQFTTKPLFMTM